MRPGGENEAMNRRRVYAIAAREELLIMSEWRLGAVANSSGFLSGGGINCSRPLQDSPCRSIKRHTKLGNKSCRQVSCDCRKLRPLWKCRVSGHSSQERLRGLHHGYKRAA